MHRPFIYLTIIGLAGVLLYFSPDLTQTREEIGEYSASTELEFDGYSEGILSLIHI